MQQRFVREEYRPMLMIENDASLLLDRFASYQPPLVRKWISAAET